ncbi:GAF domain-containing sensor histidine kinase [Pedobacter lithocola]|uniref:histidine kinase n=1 Tax=Pedobacter lithocola TaxID=1908239 RepID=A0ABV8PBK2_9SPHI
MSSLLNENDRIKSLSSYNLDYSELRENFSNLSKLAALSTGVPVCIVSLIDADTQWVIGVYGIDLDQHPRDRTICQYTIAQEKPLEINTTSSNKYFSEDFTCSGYQYYYGISIKSEEGFNIGTLCVLDVKTKKIKAKEKEILNIIASEISRELANYRAIETLGNAVIKAETIKKKVVHDVRSPLLGIVGVAKIFKHPTNQKTLKETSKAMDMIYRSSIGLLDLTNDILETEVASVPHKLIIRPGAITLKDLAESLKKLYLPQAVSKDIELEISFNERYSLEYFTKSKLLQIIGNLISNALKFTPENGEVSVYLDLKVVKDEKELIIKIVDTGVGIPPQLIGDILNGLAETSEGTSGEKGYGFGLSSVNELINEMNGKMEIKTRHPLKGTEFLVCLIV